MNIWVENINELTPQQQANVDYLISVSEFDADVIRSPKLSQSDQETGPTPLEVGRLARMRDIGDLP